ncbi:3D domain-containing protein [Pontiella sulfatireligans]|uniref:Cell wall-binding protein YocH n=1 Tax=Pontiella sulfatireligans TaxID=2750658 RepID=A0A6C2ULK3_9BACT|nr:3D domain-containing protein [Pontiella sulfatireligans]VGO21132.1 Cell wall-binding protein YocH [Pontiella sulfatireligans]
MAQKRKGMTSKKWPYVAVGVFLAWVVAEGRFYIPKYIRPPKGVEPVEVEMKTTSYCHCRRCCNYRWFLFLPYQKTGFFSFRLKHVGKTSSGATARPGTLAADTSVYPYGTVMRIPGYGYGRVEDTGGAIKENRIDLYRPNHWFACQWGVRTEKVQIWLSPKTDIEDVSDLPKEGK